MRQERHAVRTARNSASSERSIADVLVAIIILNVLAGVYVPRYLRLRPVIKARACKERIQTLAASSRAFMLQNGRIQYAPTAAYKGAAKALGGVQAYLVGLPSRPVCPLDGNDYDVLADGGGRIIIRCPNARAHAKVYPPLKAYVRRGRTIEPGFVP